MQLVMRRRRVESGGKPFVINARMVLYSDEKELLDRYRLQNVVLTPGNRARDIKKAVIFSAIITFVVWNVVLPIWMVANRIILPFHTIGLILMLCFGLGTFFIYHHIREEVRVNDLLTGRDFKARSFLELLLKEQMIRKAAAIFQKVVDQARTWHEPEVIELLDEPLPTVLEGYREAA